MPSANETYVGMPQGAVLIQVWIGPSVSEASDEVGCSWVLYECPVTSVGRPHTAEANPKIAAVRARFVPLCPILSPKRAVPPGTRRTIAGYRPASSGTLHAEVEGPQSTRLRSIHPYDSHRFAVVVEAVGVVVS